MNNRKKQRNICNKNPQQNSQPIRQKREWIDDHIKKLRINKWECTVNRIRISLLEKSFGRIEVTSKIITNRTKCFSEGFDKD